MEFNFAEYNGYMLASAVRGPDFAMEDSSKPYYDLHLELKHTFTARVRFFLGVSYGLCEIRDTPVIRDVHMATKYNAACKSESCPCISHYLYHILDALIILKETTEEHQTELSLMINLVRTMFEGNSGEIQYAFGELIKYGELWEADDGSVDG